MGSRRRARRWSRRRARSWNRRGMRRVCVCRSFLRWGRRYRRCWYTWKRKLSGAAKKERHAKALKAAERRAKWRERRAKARARAMEALRKRLNKPLAHAGKDCWRGCRRKQGKCRWCGTEGMCCRVGWRGNGCNGKLGIRGKGHVCVANKQSDDDEGDGDGDEGDGDGDGDEGDGDGGDDDGDELLELP